MNKEHNVIVEDDKSKALLSLDLSGLEVDNIDDMDITEFVTTDTLENSDVTKLMAASCTTCVCTCSCCCNTI